MTPRFDSRSAEEFSRLSGDFNPLHLDPLVARRFRLGRPVVHGLRLALLALEHVFEAPAARILESLQVDFRRAVLWGERIAFETRDASEGAATVILRAGSLAKARVKLSWSCGALDDPGQPLSFDACSPKELDPAAVVGAGGELELGFEVGRLASQFPRVARSLSPIQVAELLASTRLVGMECPGLHSLFSKLDLRRAPGGGEALEYQVRQVDERYQLVTLDVKGPTLEGQLTSLIRSRPVQQPDLASLAKLVEPGEFAGQVALILGGSRGLGEVFAKLLAAGGARVAITYRTGRADAEAVVRELSGAGHEALALPYDVTAADNDLSALEGFGAPTWFIPCATPPIFVSKGKRFDRALFESFAEVYVAGFERTLHELPSVRAVLYPSSVALEDTPPNLLEYAAAKAAGEALCRGLSSAVRPIVVSRLPRLETDQTATPVSVPTQPVGPTLLSVLRDFRAALPGLSRRA